MINATDVNDYADDLVRRRGENALLVAAQRAIHHLDAGDRHGYEVWLRIAKATVELLGSNPPRNSASARPFIDL